MKGSECDEKLDEGVSSRCTCPRACGLYDTAEPKRPETGKPEQVEKKSE